MENEDYGKEMPVINDKHQRIIYTDLPKVGYDIFRGLHQII